MASPLAKALSVLLSFVLALSVLPASAMAEMTEMTGEGAAHLGESAPVSVGNAAADGREMVSEAGEGNVGGDAEGIGSVEPEPVATTDGTAGSDALAYELSLELGEEPAEYAVAVPGEEAQGDSEVTLAPETLPIAAVAGAGEDDGSLSVQADVMASGWWGSCPWTIDANGTLTVRPGWADPISSPWRGWEEEITSVNFVSEDGRKVSLSGSARGLLKGCPRLPQWTSLALTHRP